MNQGKMDESRGGRRPLAGSIPEYLFLSKNLESDTES